ncbi:MAG: hypothetical protein ACI4Q6_04655, partial [Huintestinicola sp.]
MTAYYILMLLICGLGYPMCIYKPDKRKTMIYVCIVFVYMFFMSTGCLRFRLLRFLRSLPAPK